MKTMIFSLAMAAAMITPLCACSDDDSTLEQRIGAVRKSFFQQTKGPRQHTISLITDTWATLCRSSIRWLRTSK